MENTPLESPKKYSAPALEKGLEIIELLAEVYEGLTLTNICAQLGRSKPEIFRMISVLKDQGYIEYFPQNKFYRLSLKLFRLSNRFAPIQQLNNVAFPLIQQLCEKTEQSYHLVVYSNGGGLISAYQDYENNSNHLILPVGGRGPLVNNCAGHILLSFSSYDDTARMLEAYKSDINSNEFDDMELSKIIVRVKKQGYEEMNSPVLIGVHDIGFPIYDHRENIMAVIMTSILLYKDNQQNPNFESLKLQMQKTALLISNQFGYQDN